jgi:hypothetical protein
MLNFGSLCIQLPVLVRLARKSRVERVKRGEFRRATNYLRRGDDEPLFCGVCKLPLASYTSTATTVLSFVPRLP